MDTPPARADRPLDIVLWGATGFTGRLVAEYLAAKGEDVAWALAGRSREKLTALRTELASGRRALESLPLRTAEAHDRASLDAMVREARVVITTVGPYLQYGRELAAACAANGTDYCDLTGEVPFIRQTIDDNHERARKTGAFVVPCCGFDSIPSDLGTLMMAEYAKRERGKGLSEVRYFAGDSKGGVSGGTIASALGTFELVQKDRDLRRLIADPYALSPDRARDLDLDQGDALGVRFDDELGSWTGPFVMAAVNTRVVRRSNALADHAYGKRFRYSEVASYGKGPKGLGRAVATTAFLGAFMGVAAVRALRPLLERVVPAPGEGPSKEVRDSGYFNVHLLGTVEGDSAPSLRGHVRGTSDPGYGETAKMLAESALCLATERAALREEGGVLTPATAMGMRLVERLRAAGMTFSVEPYRLSV